VTGEGESERRGERRVRGGEERRGGESEGEGERFWRSVDLLLNLSNEVALSLPCEERGWKGTE
jgi:hypothetical protein